MIYLQMLFDLMTFIGAAALGAIAILASGLLIPALFNTRFGNVLGVALVIACIVVAIWRLVETSP